MGCTASSQAPSKVAPDFTVALGTSIAPVVSVNKNASNSAPQEPSADFAPIPASTAFSEQLLDSHSQGESGLYFREATATSSNNLLALVKRGDLHAVKEVVQAEGIDVNVKGMWNSTPLIISAQYGFVEVANTLLDIENVDVNHLNEKGAGALLFACVEGKTSLVKRLLDLGAKSNVEPALSVYNTLVDRNMSATPLSSACVNGYADIVQLLLDSGMDANTPFSFTLSKPSGGAASKADISTSQRCTPLMLSCGFSRASVIRTLVTAGASLDVKDKDGATALHHLARGGKAVPEAVLVLKELNVLTTELANVCDARGESALHVACDQKQLELARLLLECGCMPTIHNTVDGITPLHIAVKKRNLDILSLLIEWGADPLAEDFRGVSPVDLTGTLKRDSPIVSKVEEAATSWRAKKMVMTAVQQLQQQQQQLSSSSEVASVGVDNKLSTTSSTAAAAAADSKSAQEILRTPNPNQQSDYLDGLGAESGVAGQLSELACSSSFKSLRLNEPLHGGRAGNSSGIGFSMFIDNSSNRPENENEDSPVPASTKGDDESGSDRLRAVESVSTTTLVPTRPSSKPPGKGRPVSRLSGSMGKGLEGGAAASSVLAGDWSVVDMTDSPPPSNMARQVSMKRTEGTKTGSGPLFQKTPSKRISELEPATPSQVIPFFESTPLK